LKRIYLAVLWLLVSCAAVFGQTYSDASLNGAYATQSWESVNLTWSKTFTCPTKPTITYTAVGSVVTQQISYGTFTANGAGSYTLTTTNTGLMNTAATVKTMSVTWNSACQVTAVKSGSVVYNAPVTQTGSGPYTVSSTGTGTFTPPGVNQSPYKIKLAATNSAGISTTILFSQQVNGQPTTAGIAVHE